MFVSLTSNFGYKVFKASIIFGYIWPTLIRHDFDRKKWEAVGRILVKGYTDCQYFPLKIGKAFFTGCLFGEESVTSMMLQDFFKHCL